MQYFITKEDLEKLGCKVITGSSPVTCLNGRPMLATQFKFKNMSALSNSDLVTDTKAMDSYIFMCDNSGLQDIGTKNPEEAESVLLRLFM